MPVQQYPKLGMWFAITIFCGVVCTISGQENKVALHVTPELILELRKYADICGKEYGVDPKALSTIIKTTLPNDKLHKQFLYCIFFNSKYIKEDGHYNIDKMLTLSPVNGTLADIKRISEDCNTKTAENNLETMYEMSFCFHQYFVPVVTKPNES